MADLCRWLHQKELCMCGLGTCGSPLLMASSPMTASFGPRWSGTTAAATATEFQSQGTLVGCQISQLTCFERSSLYACWFLLGILFPLSVSDEPTPTFLAETRLGLGSLVRQGLSLLLPLGAGYRDLQLWNVKNRRGMGSRSVFS